jgi:hypothetical protein
MRISRTLIAALVIAAAGIPAAARAVPSPGARASTVAADSHRILGLPPELRTLPGTPARPVRRAPLARSATTSGDDDAPGAAA